MSNADIETFVAYTVPSTWIGKYSDKGGYTSTVKMNSPYMRVVGLITPEGDALWVANREIEGVPDQQYSEADVEAVDLPISADQSKRFKGFFRRFMMNPPVDLQAISHKSDDFYSCHDFGAWMIGKPHINSVTKLTGIITDGELVDGALPIGMHGVIGHLRHEGALAQHSLIGLGEENPLSLQVMWNVGHMGMASYEDLNSFYVRNSGNAIQKKINGVTGNGLYTAPAPNSEA